MTYDQHTPPQPIRELPSDHHNAVDWDRVKRSARSLRPQHPLKTGATVAAGAVLGPWWTTHAVTPLLDRYGPSAAIGMAVMAGIYGSVAMTKTRPIIRRALAIALIATVTGTLYAAPVRDLISTWIVGS
ncbi:hypothetical protein AB0F71_39470 [Kitasatospora sp. NPDC028055]|uniref:hypothetical protein n=1 Tax=Kitasatospora sp. NPDC028055 TaxID=3155653 RepID=UPI0033E4A414